MIVDGLKALGGRSCTATSHNIVFTHRRISPLGLTPKLNSKGEITLATWVTHFRIAEELIKKELPVSVNDFLVGNIGPDCGLIGEDGRPTPPKEITHFKVEGNISADSFYHQYLNDGKVSLSQQFSYFLGYYIHLVTDEEWIKFTDQKKREKVFEKILNTPDYTKLVKRDWYGVDMLYLENHKENIFWTEFQHITEFPEYLNFFPNGQTLVQIRNITKFYQSCTISDDHEFIYLSPAEADKFVENTVHRVKELLNQRMSIQLAERVEVSFDIDRNEAL